MALAEDALPVAIDAARAGGEQLRGWAGRLDELLTEAKSGPHDVVTDADHASEAAILQILEAERPRDGIVSEETGARDGRSDVTWIVDPLDGTTNFLYGIPRWCVSIACCDEEGAVAGVTFDPIHDEMFAATRGGGATLNGRPIRCSDVATLDQALIGTGFAYDLDVREQQGATLLEILGRVRDIRRPGSPCLDLADVACGRTDGFYETLSAPWDRVVGMLLVEEAGGIATFRPGGPQEGLVVAAGHRLFASLSGSLTTR